MKPSKNCRVLVVDDHVDAANTTSMLLQLLGYHVHTAYSGPAGIAAADVFRPNVVLLDISMPEPTGYEVARHLREQPWGKDVFLVALTGLGQEKDRRLAEEHGFDQFLVKPV